MGVASIACYENAGYAQRLLRRLYIVKPVAQPLANFIHRPPSHFFHIQGVGVKNTLGCCNQLFLADIAPCHTLVFFQLVHLHIQAHHVATLTRNDQKTALVGRLDE